MSSSSNLLEMLTKTAHSSQTKGIKFLKAGYVYEHLSYLDLLKKSYCFSETLKKSYCPKPFERIVITLPTSPEFVIAFFGIIIAGAVPVPLPHPNRLYSPARYLSRVVGVIAKSGVSFIVTNSEILEILDKNSSFFDELNVKEIIINGDEINTDSLMDYSYPMINESDPALIQYTSGTTSQPKGVILTHSNLISNLDSIKQGLRLTSTDVCCSWLPLFHDMGLIGCLLGSINSNIDLLLMEPIEFIRDPVNWLNLFKDFKASITAAPNSAYLRCIQKISLDKAKSLDLSTWRVAMNGSEFVDARTMTDFSNHFKESGFGLNVFLSVYGMAESSLAVTFSTLGEKFTSIKLDRISLSSGIVTIVQSNDDVNNNQYMWLVSVGFAVNGMEVGIILNNGLITQEECKVGEICLKGSSVTNGYDNEAQKFKELLIDDWMRTGDLGFFYKNELYISGRTKDVIVLSGQNFYARDIELLAAQIPDIRLQDVMAFGLQGNGVELLVLFVEVRSNISDNSCVEIINSIKRLLVLELGISAYDIMLFRERVLLRTSSGKLQRHKGVELYLKIGKNPHRQ